MVGADQSRLPPFCREFDIQGAEPAADIHYVFLDPVRLHPRDCRMWWWYRRMRGFLRNARPDVIHVQSEPWGLLVIQSLVMGKTSSFTTRIAVHGADNIYHHGRKMEQMIRRRILHCVLPRLDGFASWNEAGIALASDSGLPASLPVAVVPAVVPSPARFTPPSEDERRNLRERFGLPKEGVIAAFIGRLMVEKGCLDLLEALKGLRGDAPFLAVWGKGPLEQAIAERLQSGEVRGKYGGPLDLLEIPDAMRCCEMLLIPSRTVEYWAEQFGRVAVEAMLTGCAVIAYRSGALPEVIGDGGVLVEEGDIEGLATEIALTAKDAARRRRIAERGRERSLARFHPGVLAPKMVGFWEEMLRARSGATATG